MRGQGQRSVRASRFSVPVVLLLGVALAVLRPASAQDATPAGEGERVEQVALVTPASRANQGWDQQAVDNLSAVSEERGVEVLVADNAGYEDITPTLRDFAEQGADLIVCHASGYQTVCPEFAEEEGVRVAVIENPEAATPGLVADIETQAQEAAFLAGVLAGRTTASGTVGIVASGQPPTWNYMSVGFAEGLKAARTDAKLLYAVIGEAAYEDAAGAKRETEAQLAAGADIVFGMGDGASFGMIDAIEEHNAELEEGAAPALFIDVIGDKREEHGDVLLTSVLFDYTGVYGQLLDDIEAGAFGRVHTMNVANGGVRLLDLPENVPPDVVAAVEQARQGVVAGDIEVSAIGDADGLRRRLDELLQGS